MKLKLTSLLAGVALLSGCTGDFKEDVRILGPVLSGVVSTECQFRGKEDCMRYVGYAGTVLDAMIMDSALVE